MPGVMGSPSNSAAPVSFVLSRANLSSRDPVSSECDTCCQTSHACLCSHSCLAAAVEANAVWREKAAAVLGEMAGLEAAALFREAVPRDTPLYFDVRTCRIECNRFHTDP